MEGNRAFQSLRNEYERKNRTSSSHRGIIRCGIHDTFNNRNRNGEPMTPIEQFNRLRASNKVTVRYLDGGKRTMDIHLEYCGKTLATLTAIYRRGKRDISQDHYFISNDGLDFLTNL